MSDTGRRQETYLTNYCPGDVPLSCETKGGIVDKFSLRPTRRVAPVIRLVRVTSQFRRIGPARYTRVHVQKQARLRSPRFRRVIDARDRCIKHYHSFRASAEKTVLRFFVRTSSRGFELRVFRLHARIGSVSFIIPSVESSEMPEF